MTSVVDILYHGLSKLYQYIYIYIYIPLFVLFLKVWTNLDNLIKSYNFSKFWLISKWREFPCKITYSDIVPSRGATSTTLHKHLTVGFLKLLSTHPIHIVVWRNFPYNMITCRFKESKEVGKPDESDNKY